MSINKTVLPRLTLVGAGPGDPGLITIKGINAIADADVILYDALVNTDLLKYASAKAKILFVGKRAGHHSYDQNQINKLIVENAFSYGHVVRLKGGDPFVFGRGQEELSYAEDFNITVDIVPGISSHTSLPALQHIPLTARGISESFWVLTGTTSRGKLSSDIYNAAKSSATIIILMGMGKLREIAEIFIQAGKSEAPAAVIQNGSLPDEKIVIARVKDIFKRSFEEGIGSPAIIIIGEVVALHSHAEEIFNYKVLSVTQNISTLNNL